MKSIKAALKRKSQKDRQQLGDMGACCVLLGGGGGELTCLLDLAWWHTRSLRRALPPPLPPASLAPHSAWEPVRTSQTQARLWANPPTQRMTTIPLTPISTSISKAQFFFFFFRSLILYFHHPLSILPGPLCSMRVFGMLRASQGELSIIQSELVFHVH